MHNDTAIMSRYAPDLGRDPFYRWLSTYHWVPLTVLGFALLAIGGWPLVNWAIFLRVVLGLHATYLVNSATHLWGRRRFATQDDSKNSWWVALLTFGEGWHNNHHAHPTSARHGLAWYEFDPTWIELKILRAVGLVWDVKAAKVERESPAGRDRGLASRPFVLCWDVCRLADVGDRSPSSSSSGSVSAPARWRSTSAGSSSTGGQAGMLILGFLAFPLIITGVVLNTIFLVREIRRNEQHDAFINAVTHELKTPVASIRLYLQTLQSRAIDDSKRQEFYQVMVEDTDRLVGTIDQVLRAGARRRQAPPRQPGAGGSLGHGAGLSCPGADAPSPAGRRADLPRVAGRRAGAASAGRRGRTEGGRLEPRRQRGQVLGVAGAGGRGARAARSGARHAARARSGRRHLGERAQADLQALLSDSRRGRDAGEGHRPGPVHRPIA